jgi:hypothetical protein
MKVIAKRGDRYTLRNLVTRGDKDYHVKRLHEDNHDPQTLSPLKVAWKDSGEEFQVEYIEGMKGQPKWKK